MLESDKKAGHQTMTLLNQGAGVQKIWKPIKQFLTINYGVDSDIDYE